MRSDLQIWLQFLQEYNGAMVITDNEWISNEKLQLYIDSAAWSKRVYGMYFAGRWGHGIWPKSWVDTGMTRDMTFLELFPVIAALMTWDTHLKDKKVLFHVHNQAAVKIINMKTSRSDKVMNLVRHMVLMNLKNNTTVRTVYIPFKLSNIADCLSRSQWGKFRELVPEAHQWTT
jgi:hypothetical protein